MRRGVRIPAWYLLLVAVLGILSGCQSLRDLERFARRHHGVLTQSLGLELRRPPSDSAFRYFFLQVDVGAYYITSLRTGAEALLLHMRDRWSSENSCHWPRDTQLKEDVHCYREVNGVQIMATLRSLAMNALRL